MKSFFELSAELNEAKKIISMPDLFDMTPEQLQALDYTQWPDDENAILDYARKEGLGSADRMRVMAAFRLIKAKIEANKLKKLFTQIDRLKLKVGDYTTNGILTKIDGSKYYFKSSEDATPSPLSPDSSPRFFVNLKKLTKAKYDAAQKANSSSYKASYYSSKQFQGD